MRHVALLRVRLLAPYRAHTAVRVGNRADAVRVWHRSLSADAGSNDDGIKPKTQAAVTKQPDPTSEAVKAASQKAVKAEEVTELKKAAVSKDASDGGTQEAAAQTEHDEVQSSAAKAKFEVESVPAVAPKSTVLAEDNAAEAKQSEAELRTQTAGEAKAAEPVEADLRADTERSTETKADTAAVSDGQAQADPAPQTLEAKAVPAASQTAEAASSDIDVADASASKALADEVNADREVESKPAAAGSEQADSTTISEAGQSSGSSPASGSSSSGSPVQSFGARFKQETESLRRRKDAVDKANAFESEEFAMQEEGAKEPKEVVREQLKRLLFDLRGRASREFAYLMHKKGELEPKLETPLNEEEFAEAFKIAKLIFQRYKGKERIRRKSQFKNYARLNTGYSEEDEVFNPEVDEFKGSWRTNSMREDYWKADYYTSLQRWIKDVVPEPEPLSMRTDRVADVLGEALRGHISDCNRPVLTHELADFDNPYMMKQSATARIVHERCVRGPLDERMMPRLVEKQPDLVKLRAEAKLPPEVLEPLAAFRGDVRWNFDASARLEQKLQAVDQALEAVLTSQGASESVVSALPENAAVDPGQVPGVHHPWRNHLGFESAVPGGLAGGTRMGQPEPALQAQIDKLRYPTLQRVAHTLPNDTKWRAHVARSVQVLERSKHWDYASKLRAMNSMKEVYDRLKPSSEYSDLLDEKLPLNRVPSHLTKKYGGGRQWVKTFPKKFRSKKTHERYPKGPLLQGKS
eukprot:TRINITY_DN90448_c0_g1_i1.p1 TRINITY_DN90448_c0_g1~~TRINITY_DN90448_c0_g1_i1.p1  ORF type:complete len:752 (-),score=128.72 TRINITY_DN90448_c0_g1_i1:260-2515(-)